MELLNVPGVRPGVRSWADSDEARSVAGGPRCVLEGRTHSGVSFGKELRIGTLLMN